MRGERDVEKLRRWCVRRLLEGRSIRDVSAHAMMPKSTVHDWQMRFQRKRWAELVNESRRLHIIHRLPQETVAGVIEVRQREGWYSEAIEAYLKAHGVQVSQVLSDHGPQFYSDNGKNRFTLYLESHRIRTFEPKGV